MAVFTPRALQIPNMRTDYSAENSAFSNLGQTLGNMPSEFRKEQLNAQKQQILGQIGTGNLDYEKAGRSLIALGDTQAGATLLTLGQKQQQLGAQKGIADIFSGGEAKAQPAPVLGAVTSSAPVASPGDPSLPAGMRNNNPGNIKFVGQSVPGIVGPSKNTDQGDPQAVFDTPESGMAAAYGLAMRKYSGGKRTANDLIAGNMGWTPGNMQAAANIARTMGIRPDEDLRLDDPSRAQAFMRALLLQEHGKASLAYSDDMIASAVSGARGQPRVAQRSAPLQGVEGDDPAKLRADAEYYARSNPAASQQFLVRAQAAEGQQPVQFAETEADVQRLEQAQAARSAQPVQVAQAPAQVGAPVADAPAPGAAAAQFAVPGSMLPPNDPYPRVTTQQLYGVLQNPMASDGQRAMAKSIIDNRMKYSDENAPDKREMTRLQTEKLRREVEGEGATPLTAQERKDFGVQEGQAAYKTRSGEIKFGPAGTTIKNEGTIPPGYRAVRDPNGNLERVEPIPGSKAEREANDLAEKKTKADRIKGEVGTTVGNALDDIDRLMKSATLPTTGAIGSRLAAMPGTAAHDIAQALNTVSANISFSQLQQMRESSPTGGALGNVTEGEQKLLQNSFAALSQSQTEDQFKTNLGRVRAVFERIVHGRTLTAQERKTGGPMTMERAKGLREEAAAAIAGGADRAAVMKRLAEDYGISASGL